MFAVLYTQGIENCTIVPNCLDLLGDYFKIRKWEKPRYSAEIVSSF